MAGDLKYEFERFFAHNLSTGANNLWPEVQLIAAGEESVCFAKQRIVLPMDLVVRNLVSFIVIMKWYMITTLRKIALRHRLRIWSILPQQGE